MICPHCGAEHPESDGRFCNSCGMSVYKYATRKTPEGEGEREGEPKVPLVRCRYCGVNAPPPTCPACGQRLPYPDDWKE